MGSISLLTIIGAMVISAQALPTQPVGTNETTPGSSKRLPPTAAPELPPSATPMSGVDQLPAAAAPPTTPPQLRECYHNGNWYQPGEEISRGQSGTWCYGTYCDSNGNVTEWDDLYCPTPRPPVPGPQGSRQKSPWQAFSSMMFGGGASTTSSSLANYQPSTPPYDSIKQNSRSSDKRGGNNNQVVGWDTPVDQSSLNQVHSTSKSLTRPLSTKSSQTLRHIDQVVLNTTSSNRVTTAHDQVGSNRTYNTLNTLTGTASQNNIKPTQTFTPPSQPKKCYHNGKWFLAGQDISEGRRGSYCYGLYCDQNGEIQKWDDYNCNWNSQTTIQPLPPHNRGTTDLLFPTSTPYYPTTPYYSSSTAWGGQTGGVGEGVEGGGGGGGGQGQSRGCNYHGQIYELGDEIMVPQPLQNGQCLTRTCSETGRVVQKRLNCALALLLRTRK